MKNLIKLRNSRLSERGKMRMKDIKSRNKTFRNSRGGEKYLKTQHYLVSRIWERLKYLKICA